MKSPWRILFAGGAVLALAVAWHRLPGVSSFRSSPELVERDPAAPAPRALPEASRPALPPADALARLRAGRTPDAVREFNRAVFDRPATILELAAALEYADAETAALVADAISIERSGDDWKERLARLLTPEACREYVRVLCGARSPAAWRVLLDPLSQISRVCESLARSGDWSSRLPVSAESAGMLADWYRTRALPEAVRLRAELTLIGACRYEAPVLSLMEHLAADPSRRPEDRARFVRVICLSMESSDRAMSRALPYLGHEDVAIRRAAADALARPVRVLDGSTTGIAERLERVARLDPEPSVRFAAIRGLARFDRPGPGLEGLTDDEYSDVAHAVLEHLTRRDSHGYARTRPLVLRDHLRVARDPEADPIRREAAWRVVMAAARRDVADGVAGAAEALAGLEAEAR